MISLSFDDATPPWVVRSGLVRFHKPAFPFLCRCLIGVDSLLPFNLLHLDPPPLGNDPDLPSQRFTHLNRRFDHPETIVRCRNIPPTSIGDHAAVIRLTRSATRKEKIQIDLSFRLHINILSLSRRDGKLPIVPGDELRQNLVGRRDIRTPSSLSSPGSLSCIVFQSRSTRPFASGVKAKI